jgi:nitroreductase
MNSLMQTMSARRSVRQYNGRPVSDDALDAILRAGMLAPTGKGIRPYDFIVIKDAATLKKLIGCRAGGAKMLETAGAAIAVLGDENRSDTWIEDCAVSMGYMHLMASELGLGSCWLQIRLRPSNTAERSAEAFVRDLLGFPQNERLEALLVLGPIDQAPSPNQPDALPMDKVHREKW